MTQDNYVPPIHDIAIIGGGPSGIASLYDLTRTTKDGKSLFGEKSTPKTGVAFDNVVLLERNGSAGGVWSESARAENNTDPELPDFSAEDYSTPAELYKKIPVPAGIEEATYEKPLNTKKADDKYQWKSSGAYKHLFTNVPNKYMTFSFQDYTEDELKELDQKFKIIQGYQSGDQVSKYLADVVKDNDLDGHIRYNSSVERVRKLPSGKWEVVVRETDPKSAQDKWYSQLFDAVVIANGKTIPIVPKFKNIVPFSKKVHTTLAKSVKDPSYLRKSKKPLFIGSSVSAVDLIQYTFPRDTPVYISRKQSTHGTDWIDFCSYAKGIINRPEIAEFLPETNGVRFVDGTEEHGFDEVVITTGYHSYFPFIEEKQPKFYLYTFGVDDPTLGLVGNSYAIFFFNRVEYQASALAALWAGTKNLPPKQEQEKWWDEEFQQHISLFDLEPKFIQPLVPYLAEGRPQPLAAKAKEDRVYDVAKGSGILLNAWFDIRNGEISINDI